MEERYIRINDADIRYIENGTGRAVILLHGRSFNADVWKETRTLEAIADNGYRAVAFDFPGFGRSSLGKFKSFNRHGVKALSEFIKAACDELHIKDAIYLGASMGAVAALDFAIENKEYVKGLILVAPVYVDRYGDSLNSINGIPTLLIWGKNDQTSPIDNAKLIMDVNKAADLAYIGERHACYLDDPELFNKKVTEFIKKVYI
ncbi:MAG: 2-hydroxy-6-oxononadienedioate/2-hydroxy-6-oxononatrienedioate hydrolase [Candidatus Micrarchaeota archaeon]|nr:MAG: 2-hydroxy-6-oxononadienedioate/2-hydroxy-6-oxononatrienedioate hydrolase [Candidatus Micrarchaeota archaeon]